MRASKIMKAWGVGDVWQARFAVFDLLFFIACLLGLVILSISLPNTERQRIYICLGGLLLLLFILVAGILVWSAPTIRWRATQLVAAFNQLGLTGKSYLWNGRQFHGTLEGRQVDVYF